MQAPMLMPRSGEVVAAHRHAERGSLTGDARDAGPAATREALHLEKRAQHRQGEIYVPCFDRLVEPVGEFGFTRQSAVPLAAIIGDPPHSPARKFEVDQSERHVDPGAGLDHSFDACGFGALPG